MPEYAMMVLCVVMIGDPGNDQDERHSASSETHPAAPRPGPCWDLTNTVCDAQNARVKRGEMAVSALANLATYFLEVFHRSKEYVRNDRNASV